MAGPLEIPPEWERCAAGLTAKDRQRVLVLGSIDCGKSTFCRFICRRLARAGKKASIIDADIGQKDVGPPGCVTSGYPDELGRYPDPANASYYFVGSVNPFGHFLPILVGISILLDSTPAPFQIINTTGLIHGVGRILKGYKIEATRPESIVAIQRAGELEPLLSANRNNEIIRIPASRRAVAKTPERRREAREKAWQEYFRKASEITFPLDKLIFQRSLLFNGRPVAGEFLYREDSPEGTLAITCDIVDRKPRFKAIRPDFEENLLCGVSNPSSEGVGLALARYIDFQKRTITLLTPVRAESAGIIQFGDIYVSPDGRELGRKRPGDM